MSMNTPTTTTGGTTSGTDSAKEKAADAAHTVQEHASSAAGAAKHEATQVAQSAKEHARSVLDSTTEELRTQGRQQTDRLSASLGDTSQELRKMADATDRDSTLAGMVRSLADSAQRASRRLEEDGPEGVLDELRRMGRQHPMQFLAMAAAGGFLAARFVRSTDTQAIKQAVSSGEGDQQQLPQPGAGQISGTGQRDLTSQPAPTPASTGGTGTGMSSTVPGTATQPAPPRTGMGGTSETNPRRPGA